MTVLALAAVAGHSPVVALLIDAGADLKRPEQRRVGPLVPAASSARHPNRASCLRGRSTALILAAMEGHTLVVEQLIAAGAKLDVQNNKG